MRIPSYYSYFEVRPLGQVSARRIRNVAAWAPSRRTESPTVDGSSLFNYQWVKSRSLEARVGDVDQDGIHFISGQRAMRRFGIPLGVSLLNPDPKSWPENIDELASSHRPHHYFRTISSSEAAEYLCRSCFPWEMTALQADAEVNQAWFDPLNGWIAESPRDATVSAVHSFAVLDFDHFKEDRLGFTLVNSWGQDWGDNGFGYLSLDSFDRYVLSAWANEGIGVSPPTMEHAGILNLLWKVSLGKQHAFDVHGREIVDATTGERIAWAFARTHRGFVDLEEFVVWPSERGKGYGRELSEMVLELARETGMPLRAWVPFADAEPENHASLEAAMRLLRLHLHTSENRGVSYLGLQEPARGQVNPFLPPRATSTRDALRPTSGSKPEVDGGKIIRVWYATNRQPKDPSNPSEGFGAKRGNTTRFGTVEVAIPKSHRFGSVGSHWLQRWLAWEDDRLKVIAQKAHEASKFWDSLRDRLTLAPGDSLAFIHGYNVSFEHAAIRTAQIAADLKIAGEAAFFSWPSRGNYQGYNVDEASIEASEPAIAEFLFELSESVRPQRLHVIAHSMGNRGFIRSLQRIVERVADRTERPFGQVILAAADLDADLFRNLAPMFGLSAERTTLYASPADRAVKLSKWFHGYPRVGFTPPVTIVPGVDTVVVPRFDLLDLGHGYFAEADAVLHDIFHLLSYGAEPRQRQRLSERVDSTGAHYWEMME